MLLGKTPMPNLSGSPIGDVTWLDDGEHFLQRKEERTSQGPRRERPIAAATVRMRKKSRRRCAALPDDRQRRRR